MFHIYLQAEIDRRVLINAVDIHDKFKTNAVSNDIFNMRLMCFIYFTSWCR